MHIVGRFRDMISNQHWDQIDTYHSPFTTSTLIVDERNAVNHPKMYETYENTTLKKRHKYHWWFQLI